MFTYPTLLISYVYSVLYHLLHLYVIHVSLATLNSATLFTYPTLLISYVDNVLDTIYCIFPMTFFIITHSYTVPCESIRPP